MAQAPTPSLTEEQLAGFTYRALGPYRAGSWVADIAVPDAPQKSHLYTFYVAVRYGGLWKTTNNGTTFQPVFDGQDVTGIGCLAIAPSNENIVWVGTGDASSVRVAYPGDGVYKSIDAGKTWQHMGLRDTQHIARIVIHPTNPDIVYVAAMGHLWSPNEERGVFKTTDGGKTWKKVLYVNDKTGAIDLVVNRRQPDTLYAAMYDVQRRPWKLVEERRRQRHPQDDRRREDLDEARGRAADAPQGRIGLDIYQKNPNILYAVIENFGKRPPTEDEARRDRAREHRAAAAQHRRRGLPHRRRREDLAEDERGDQDDVSSKAGYSFNQIRVDQNNDKRIIINCDSLLSSEDGGRTWTGLTWDSRNLFAQGRSATSGRCGSIRRTPTGWILGSDGGVHVSYDAGKTCDHYAEHSGRRVLRHHGGHGGPVPHLRRPAGPRLVARAGQRPGRAGRARGLGDGRRQRRDVQPRGPDRQPVGLQHRSSGAGTTASTRRRARGRRSCRRGRPASRRSGGTGRRRWRSRRSTAASSTPARRCSSGRSTRATTGRRSAPT